MLDALQLSHSKESPVTEVKKQHSHKTNFTSCNVSAGKPSEQLIRSRSYNCLNCNAKHPLYSCQKLINLDLDTKLKSVRERKLSYSSHEIQLHTATLNAVSHAVYSSHPAKLPSTDVIQVNKAHNINSCASTVLLSTALILIPDIKDY